MLPVLSNRIEQPGRVASRAAGMPVAGVLAAIARLRGGKAVHPQGVSYSAEFRVGRSEAAPRCSRLLGEEGIWPAIVRFSRSIGVPRPLPDLLGVSIRVLDAYGEGGHQDFLMVSSVDLPVLHHIFLPAKDIQQRPYSSSLPYRAGERTFLVGVRSDRGSPRPSGGDEFDRLAKAADSDQLRFEFLVAPLFGQFERIGEVRIGSKLPDEMNALRFNPYNTGADLEPVGMLNRWRRDAYPLSQRAWGATQGRALSQAKAEELMREEAARQRSRRS